MHSFAIADRVSKVKAFMLVVTATQPMNLKISSQFITFCSFLSIDPCHPPDSVVDSVPGKQVIRVKPTSRRL